MSELIKFLDGREDEYDNFENEYNGCDDPRGEYDSPGEIDSNPHQEIKHKLTAIKHNSIIVFRNRIYRIIKDYDTIFDVLDYFRSKDPYDISYDRHTVMYVYITDNKLAINDDYLKGIAYETFILEMEVIEESDVPMKVIECIRNIQQTKIAPNIPSHIIIEHEKNHESILQKHINEYIGCMMHNIISALEKSNKLLEVYSTKFSISEYTISRNKAILYNYPNQDGIYRKTFKEYIDYIFQKIYPIQDIVSDGWMAAKIYELLCAHYPMLHITLDGNNYIINLNNLDVLH